MNELHLTKSKFENSIILKRFIFYLLYIFTDLSYIAFIRLDLDDLRKELMSIFTIDEIRRIIKETIIPYLSKQSIIQKVKQEKLEYSKNIPITSKP